MNEKLLDISGKIDELTISVFEAIVKEAVRLEIPFFVVGAAARDMILEHGYGVGIQRATQDIDIGINVSNWDQFERLSEQLIKFSGFSQAQEKHRLRFENKIPLDIVPFGSIEDENNQIRWPPDHDTVLNVMGFNDAYENTQVIRIRAKPVLDIKVATLSGLAVLKLISWEDRSHKDKDAKDLDFIITNYLEAGNQDRLYNENEDILVEYDFNYELAGARLLGRDVSKVVNQNTKAALLEILNQETDENGQFLLVTKMKGFPNTTQSDFEKKVNLVKALYKGIIES